MPKTNTDALSQQERMARDHLAQGRFRKARDDFKQLCKADRSKYLPLLLEANYGLAREMAAKGMAGEVKQLVDYLKTIAPAEQIIALEFELGLHECKTADDAAVRVLHGLLSNADAPIADRRRIADSLVLTEQTSRPPDPGPLERERFSVQDALDAVAAAEYTRASDLLRGISHASPYSHWRVFLKGLIAFYTGQREKAGRFFQEIAPGTAPAFTAQAFLLLLGQTGTGVQDSLPSEWVVEAACTLAGQKGGGSALLRAQRAWLQRHPGRAYEILRGGFPRFPSLSPDHCGLLSELAVNEALNCTGPARESYWQTTQNVMEGRNTTHFERVLFSRLDLLLSVVGTPWPDLDSSAAEYLVCEEKVFGASPKLESTVYAWLGLNALNAMESKARYRGPRDRDAQRCAESWLRRAAERDPGNLVASLALCRLYDLAHRPSDRNKLLDVLGKQFPDDKNVLVLAGKRCLERKAHKKGIGFLLRARQLDQIDHEIADLLVQGYLLYCADLFRQGRHDVARKTLSEIEPLQSEHSQHYLRSPWAVIMGQCLLESTLGDPGRGATLWQKALSTGTPEPVLRFWAVCAGSLLNVPSRQQVADFNKFCQRKANATDAVLLTNLYTDWSPRLREVGDAAQILDDYLDKASRKPFLRSEALKIVDFCDKHEYFSFTGHGFVVRQLKQDRKDPAFRLAAMKLGAQGEYPDREGLNSVIEEATKRKETSVAREAQKMLDKLRRSPLPFTPFMDPEAEDDDEDEGAPEWDAFVDSLDDLADEPETDSGDLPRSPKEELRSSSSVSNFVDAMMAGASPQRRDLISKFLRILGTASPEDIETILRNPPPGISRKEMERLILEVREMMRAEKQQNQASPQPPGPFQGDLF